MTHRADDIALIMDITGTCNHCHHHTGARLVAYYDGTILIRCGHCKTANQFEPDSTTSTDPKKFAPFINDEDEENKFDG